jgi:nucleoside 2-deoxyribosyltransferase
VNPSVYLAGPITGLTYEGATDWRDDVREQLYHFNINAFSPLRGKSYLKGKYAIADKYDEFAMSTEQAITARDRFDCTRCDLVLFNFLGAPKTSVGSCIELGWADGARRPSILVIEPTGNLHDHSMVRAICGWRVASINAAVEIIKLTLLP